MQHFIKGVLGSLAIHVLFALAAFGLALWFTSEYSHASEAVALEFADADDAESQVMIKLEMARAALTAWIWPAMVTSFLASVVFLGLADRTMPANPTQAGSKKGLWTVLLLVNLAVALILWFVLVSQPDAAYAMLFGNYALVVFATFTLVFLGYYAATAGFVKRTMARSVPLAPMMRGVS